MVRDHGFLTTIIHETARFVKIFLTTYRKYAITALQTALCADNATVDGQIKENGCASALGALIALPAILAGTYLIYKRKES